MPVLSEVKKDFSNLYIYSDFRHDRHAQHAVELAYDSSFPQEKMSNAEAQDIASDIVGEEIDRIQKSFKEMVAVQKLNPKMQILVGAAIVVLFRGARYDSQGYADYSFVYSQSGQPASDHARIMAEQIEDMTAGQVKRRRGHTNTPFVIASLAMDIMAEADVEPLFCLGHFSGKEDGFLSVYRPTVKRAPTTMDQPHA